MSEPRGPKTTAEWPRPEETFQGTIESRVSLLAYHRDGVHVVELPSGDSRTFGRAADTDASFRDDCLSRHHARFVRDGDRVWVEDLASTNGTWYRGERIEQAELSPGDEVSFGEVTVCVHVRPGAGEPPVLALDTHDQFRARLDAEVTRASTFRRQVGLLLVRAASAEGTGRLARWLPEVRKLLRPVNRVAVYGPDTVEIAMPEADDGQLRTLADAVLAEGARRARTPLRCGLALYPSAARSTEALLDVCRDALRATSDDAPIVVAAPQAVHAWPADDETGATAEAMALGRAMQPVYDMVRRIAGSSVPVLITGETGAGKEVVARAIHRWGLQRRTRPMRTINCGAIPSTLIESVLFGHERGAFTGATQRAKGIFEEADGGTVLLDEIGELSPQAQAALLRVLETKRISRVGSSREIAVDVRVLAATHRDLEAMCAAGTFREDLFYRLNTFLLRVPPLRERLDEIPALVAQFIEQARDPGASEMPEIANDAVQLLCAHTWPGNVRELKNVIDRAVVIAQGPTIRVEDLPDRLRERKPADPSVPEDTASRLPPAPPAHPADSDIALDLHAPPPAAERARRPTLRSRLEEQSRTRPVAVRSDAAAPSFRRRVAAFEAALLRRVLEETGWNRSEAARRMHMPRATLKNKIHAYDIQRERAETAETDPGPLAGLGPDAREGLGGPDFKTSVRRFESSLLLEALSATGWNQTAAAQRVGIPLRTLVHKIRAYGLTRPTAQTPAGGDQPR